MTVKEAYGKMNGDYAEISARLLTDERILKFLGMFSRDTTFSNLCEQMDNENYEEAFRAAHTMKGLCQNMAFSGLLEPLIELTECLRGGNCTDGTLEYYEQVKERYQLVQTVISELLES